MFKKFFPIICAASLTLAFASCEKETESNPEQLAAPSLSLTEQTENSFTVSWNAVQNAAGYSYALQDEAEQSTTETSVSFSGLEPGSYTLKVKATSNTEEWTDSDYSEISVTLTETERLTFSFEIADLTATSATVICTPSDENAPYWFDVMSKADFDAAAADDEQFMNEILNELIALGEEEGLSTEETLEILLSLGEDSWKPTLTPSTEYVAYAFGINYDGSFTSTLQTQNFTSLDNGGGDVNPDIEKWLGTWSATTTGKLEWYLPDGSQYLEATYHENDPMTATFTIEQDPDNPSQALIYGWSQVNSETPAVCLVNESGDLEVYSDVAVGQESDGYTPTWLAYCDLGDGNYNIVTGQFPAYTFTLNGESATCTRYNGQLNDGRTFSTLSLEIYASTSNSYAIYGESFPVYFLAGDINLTRSTTSPKAAAVIATGEKVPAYNTCKVFSSMHDKFVSAAE